MWNIPKYVFQTFMWGPQTPRKKWCGVFEILQKSFAQFHNDKMVQRSTHNRYNGLILWSRANNLGKSSYMNTICDIGHVYRHTHTDMKRQDTFDAGTEPEHAYCAYFIDAMPNLSIVSISLLEMIDFQNVKIPKRYRKKHSHLPKGTPILITSNMSPYDLFVVHLAMIQERFMIANIDGVPLFLLINYIITVHGLPEYEAPAEHPVANIGLWFRYFHKVGEGWWIFFWWGKGDDEDT